VNGELRREGPGMDLTLDGQAARATEPETLEKAATL
jgi:hypothetical protein